MRAYHPLGKGPSISHLLFADDCLSWLEPLFLIRLVLRLLLMFIATYQVKQLIFFKSQLMISPKTTPRIKNQIRSIVQINFITCRWKYLEVPIFSMNLSREDYSFIVEKMTSII